MSKEEKFQKIVALIPFDENDLIKQYENSRLIDSFCDDIIKMDEVLDILGKYLFEEDLYTIMDINPNSHEFEIVQEWLSTYKKEHNLDLHII